MSGEGRTIGSLIEAAALRLGASGIEGGRRDARILMGHVTGLDHAGLISAAGEVVDGEVAGRFEVLVERRASGEPVHRILGHRDFFGRNFTVAPGVLEPRPETELLVARVLEDFAPDRPWHFADIGTGSGVIAVSLLCELPLARAVASDLSAAVLSAARANARRHGVLARLETVEADILPQKGGAELDFAVSNPPYIETGALPRLQREVRLHDPVLALDGGRDGLDVYRKIFTTVQARLKPGAPLYLETGHGQHSAIGALAAAAGWSVRSTHADLAGLERVMVIGSPGQKLAG